MYKNHPKPLQVGSRPTPPGIPNPTCRVTLETWGVLDNAKELHRRVRKLRHSTQRCYTCPEKAECHLVRRLTHALGITLRELAQEWGWDQE